VIVCYKSNYEKAESVTNSINKCYKGAARTVFLDVTDRNSILDAVGKIKEEKENIDILVNNAGINKPNDFDKISEKEWDEVMDVNLKGAFKVSQVLSLLLSIGGSIINISSVSGQIGGPRSTHYAASKAGLLSLTQNMAIFFAKKNIRVNSVSAGLIQSDMAESGMNLGLAGKTLLNRMGEPEEVAKVVAFLASNDASYITGQTINVNGGMFF
jgi:3-oxoacyl-[acyl-carrier protein] reductase